MVMRMEDVDYIRLHITPFTPALLNTYLPSAILPSARNISYHQIETFPERAYGYVSLPTMEAEKIKKKLNNTILKGTKVRIEAARPEPPKPVPEPAETKKEHKKKKRKREEIPGADIGERSVKRGWTVPATQTRAKGVEKKERVEKSKFTTAPECLFKTVLPPNVVSKGSTKESTKEGKGKGKQAVVHEFSKSTRYATFLRSSGGSTNKKPAAEFIKGRGWVDEDGNLVEAVKASTRSAPEKVKEDGKANDEESSSEDEHPSREKSVPTDNSATKNVVVEDSDQESTSTDSSSSDEDEASGQSSSVIKPVTKVPETTLEDEDSSDLDSTSDLSSDSEPEAEISKSVAAATSKSTSLNQPAADPSSNSSSSSDSSSDSDSDSDSDTSTPTKPSTSRPQSSAGPNNLSITIPALPQTVTTTATSTAVHPLEALYKRPTSLTTITESTSETKVSAPSFSFFGADEEDIDMEANEAQEPQVPLTPYTQRDFEWRGMRSAAPTPDTAHANKRFIWPVDGDDEDDEDDEVTASTPLKNAKTTSANKATDASTSKSDEKAAGGDESEFQKWFYEHRGEANRAWKKRRKVVGKEKRQRENRKRESRV